MQQIHFHLDQRVRGCILHPGFLLFRFEKEIYINKNEVDVFNRKSLDDITITDKKVKAWLITVEYNKENYNKTRDKLLNGGYSFENNKNKQHFVIGPFADPLQAREESTKMKKIYNIQNTISSFVF